MLPELPSEQSATKWIQSLQTQIKLYGRTAYCALRSPTSLIINSIYRRSKGNTEVCISPLLFTILNLLFASLIYSMANRIIGVDRPFFNDLSYRSNLEAHQYWIVFLQNLIPKWYNAIVIVRSLMFAIVLMVVVFWVRVLSKSKRMYRADLFAMSYLLPIFLITDIVVYITVNLTYRLFQEHLLFFYAVFLLITLLSILFISGIILRVIDQVYFAGGRRRTIHMIGSVMFVPILLWILSVALNIIPTGVHAYSVIRPFIDGYSKLQTGNYEMAEKFFDQAIKKDLTGHLSCDAHILLISTNARRILANLSNLSYDSGLRKNLLNHYSQIDPFRRVINILRIGESIKVAPEKLIEIRDALLDYFLATVEIPVTDSELNCALKLTATNESCYKLPKEVIERYPDSPGNRQTLSLALYRKKMLDGEPTTADTYRYLQFLTELPIRNQLQFVQYRARNLYRESETLARIDLDDRSGLLDRDKLIAGNKKIIDMGYKFPHLKIPDSLILKLSNRELGFSMRQTYLNYLATEANLLSTLSIFKESIFIRQQITSIKNQLDWIATEAMYVAPWPARSLMKRLIKQFGKVGEHLPPTPKM